MPRCNDCNKFCALDDSQEPDFNIEVDADAGLVTGEVGIALCCAECGAEVRTGSFDVSEDITAAIAEHKKAAAEEREKQREEDRARGVEPDEDDDVECEFDVEVDGEVTSRKEKRKTLYGYHATYHVSCSTCSGPKGDVWSGEIESEMAASELDEA